MESILQQAGVMEAPTISTALVVKDKQWRDEYDAFTRMLPELLKVHQGKFVAVQNGAVIAVADTFKDAAVQAYQRVGYIPLHVGLVSNAAPPTVRIPSPRFRSSALSA